MLKESASGNFIIIKPHHLLDFLYDLAINNRHEGEINYYGSNNAFLCCYFIDGKMKTIKFTPFVDDICRPCINLINNKCIDTFDEITTKNYGTNLKNEFNYQLDIKLNAALPDIFKFDEEQNMIDVLNKLKEKLTPEIIDLYLWKRPDRSALTMMGVSKAIEIYSK